MAENKRKKYTRAEIRRNRIIVAVGFAAVVGLIVLLCALLGPKKAPRGYEQQGPVAADDKTVYLTGRDLYDFSVSVPESTKVSADFFDDALFIGESHVGGLVLINKTFPGAAVLYSNSASVANGISASYSCTDSEGSSTVVLSEYLQSHSFGKVYIQLGLNELGWSYKEKFADSYTEFVKEINTLCPNAQIFLCSLIPVSAAQSASSADYNNTNIEYYNTFILSTARKLELFYLDIGAAYADETGAMASEYTDNGININYSKYTLWYDYTATHVPPEYAWR